MTIIPDTLRLRDVLAAGESDEDRGFPVELRSPGTADDVAGMLVITGELDMGTATIVRAALAARPRILAVDCSGVTFIDSAGLDSIVDPTGGRMILLVNPSPVVARLLDLLDRHGLWWSTDGPVLSAN